MAPSQRHLSQKSAQKTSQQRLATSGRNTQRVDERPSALCRDVRGTRGGCDPRVHTASLTGATTSPASSARPPRSHKIPLAPHPSFDPVTFLPIPTPADVFGSTRHWNLPAFWIDGGRRGLGRLFDLVPPRVFPCQTNRPFGEKTSEQYPHPGSVQRRRGEE